MPSLRFKALRGVQGGLSRKSSLSASSERVLRARPPSASSERLHVLRVLPPCPCTFAAEVEHAISAVGHAARHILTQVHPHSELADDTRLKRQDLYPVCASAKHHLGHHSDTESLSDHADNRLIVDMRRSNIRLDPICAKRCTDLNIKPSVRHKKILAVELRY